MKTVFLSVSSIILFVSQLTAQDLATHDFEDGTLGDWTVCTTQNPNYVRAINGRMKTWWTEVGYNGTRMDKGAEACADQIVFNKEGWYGMKVELGSDYPNHTKGAIAQVFGFKPGFWSWSGLLEMIGGDLVVIHRRGGGGHTEAVIYEDFPNEQEFSIIIHFVLSDNNAGMFQVYIDGVLTYDKQNINFGMGDFTANDLQDVAGGSYTVCKIGQYNHTDTEYISGETRTVYYDNVSWYNGGSEGFDIVNPDKGISVCNNITALIEAECYDDMSGITTEASSEGTDNIGNIQNDDWAVYNNIDLSDVYSINARVATVKDGVSIEVRLDALDGAVLATVPVTNTGGWQTWVTEQVNIGLVDGRHDIYLIFKGGTGGILNVNWFGFSEDFICDNTTEHIEAECYDDMDGIQTEDCSEGTLNVGWINDGDWMKYNAVDLTDMKSIKARVSGKTTGSVIEVRTDAANGNLIAEIPVTNTGGNQNWTTDSVSIETVTGAHDIYLVFKGETGYLFNINWLSFSEESHIITDVNNGLTSELKIYPNPTSSTIQILNEAGSKAYLYNAKGDLILSDLIKDGSHQMNLNTAPAGIYYLKIKNSEHVKLKKIIKN